MLKSHVKGCLVLQLQLLLWLWFEKNYFYKKYFYALFVSRKVNSRNSLSLFSNVWQSSGNLVKGKLIPVNKNSLLYPQESVFLSLSKGKHFPIFTDKTI
jgi:hypothetical protein